MDPQLLRLVEERGLHIIERPGPTRGGFDPARSVIRISPGMSRRTTRSVLAHELGHAALRHAPAPRPALRARQEHQADAWAARLLITPQSYAAAEHLRGPHPASLAFELEVTVELIVAYQALLRRAG